MELDFINWYKYDLRHNGINILKSYHRYNGLPDEILSKEKLKKNLIKASGVLVKRN
jgi:hypothetical protein